MADQERAGEEQPVLTVEKIQEVADSLVWRRAEGVLPTMDTENWCIGFAGGWNSALRLLAKEIDPDAEITTKAYYARLVIVGCPEGHEEFKWATVDDKAIGNVTCSCGWTTRCRRHTAQEHHESHRTREANNVLAASKVAPTEMTQGFRG